MAADVQRMGGGGGGGDPKAAATKDLLASSFFNSQELDLDLHVPLGWEKRLDLKSGRVYLQRCSSDASNPCLDHKQTLPKLQDLNSPPSTHMMMFQDSTGLDLKLASSSTQFPPTVYQSVCTLDKVKSALQRAEKEPPPVSKKRSQVRGAAWWCNSSPPSHSSSSEVDDDDARPVAAGCPGCLSYVLVVTGSPQCPRCGTLVPLPPFKKPCIDLNISM